MDDGDADPDEKPKYPIPGDIAQYRSTNPIQHEVQRLDYEQNSTDNHRPLKHGQHAVPGPVVVGLRGESRSRSGYLVDASVAWLPSRLTLASSGSFS